MINTYDELKFYIEQDNIAIGENTVVTKSFLEESVTIAGVPAKKISNKGTIKFDK